MKANVWLAWALCGTLVCTLTYNPLYLLVLLASVWAVAASRGVAAIAPVRAAVVFSVPLIIINALFLRRGETVLFEIPKSAFGIPLYFIGGEVTAEAMVNGMFFSILLACMFLIFGVFEKMAGADSLIRAAPPILSKSALMAAIALRFVPCLIADSGQIADAQRARGLRLSGGGIGSVASRSKILMPSLIGGLERSLNLAEALESRGYGGPRTDFRKSPKTANDIVPLLAISLSASFMIAFWSLGRLEAPRVDHLLSAFPPFDPLVAASIMLLAAPALNWRTPNVLKCKETL